MIFLVGPRIRPCTAIKLHQIQRFVITISYSIVYGSVTSMMPYQVSPFTAGKVTSPVIPAQDQQHVPSHVVACAVGCFVIFMRAAVTKFGCDADTLSLSIHDRVQTSTVPSGSLHKRFNEPMVTGLKVMWVSICLRTLETRFICLLCCNDTLTSLTGTICELGLFNH